MEKIDHANNSLMRMDIGRRFTYHAPKPGQPERYTQTRDTAKKFAVLLVTECPESRELSLALDVLEMLKDQLIAEGEVG